MTTLIKQLTQHEQINFLLTNRIPRRLATQLMGWYSKIESPLLTRLTLFLWKIFAEELDLSEARKTSFDSLHDCFIRELKPGSRPINTDTRVIVSPSDAIIGAFGQIENLTAYQAKGYPYELSELIPDPSIRETYRNGIYMTLRLKSTMYHRFHAPADCHLDKITYISGDTWNVNPVALKRIEKLFCRNERAVLQLTLAQNAGSITLVPVAAILVASMKFHAIEQSLNLNYNGPNNLTCDAIYHKGDEMGYFEHGSTILLFATDNYAFADGIEQGMTIKMGQSLLIDQSVSA